MARRKRKRKVSRAWQSFLKVFCCRTPHRVGILVNSIEQYEQAPSTSAELSTSALPSTSGLPPAVASTVEYEVEQIEWENDAQHSIISIPLQNPVPIAREEEADAEKADSWSVDTTVDSDSDNDDLGPLPEPANEEEPSCSSYPPSTSCYGTSLVLPSNSAEMLTICEEPEEPMMPLPCLALPLPPTVVGDNITEDALSYVVGSKIDDNDIVEVNNCESRKEESSQAKVSFTECAVPVAGNESSDTQSIYGLINNDTKLAADETERQEGDTIVIDDGVPEPHPVVGNFATEGKCKAVLKISIPSSSSEVFMNDLGEGASKGSGEGVTFSKSGPLPSVSATNEYIIHDSETSIYHSESSNGSSSLSLFGSISTHQPSHGTSSDEVSDEDEANRAITSMTYRVDKPVHSVECLRKSTYGVPETTEIGAATESLSKQETESEFSNLNGIEQPVLAQERQIQHQSFERDDECAEDGWLDLATMMPDADTAFSTELSGRLSEVEDASQLSTDRTLSSLEGSVDSHNGSPPTTPANQRFPAVSALRVHLEDESLANAIKDYLHESSAIMMFRKPNSQSLNNVEPSISRLNIIKDMSMDTMRLNRQEMETKNSRKSKTLLADESTRITPCSATSDKGIEGKPITATAPPKSTNFSKRSEATKEGPKSAKGQSKARPVTAKVSNRPKTGKPDSDKSKNDPKKKDSTTRYKTPKITSKSGPRSKTPAPNCKASVSKGERPKTSKAKPSSATSKKPKTPHPKAQSNTKTSRPKSSLKATKHKFEDTTIKSESKPDDAPCKMLLENKFRDAAGFISKIEPQKPKLEVRIYSAEERHADLIIAKYAKKHAKRKEGQSSSKTDVDTEESKTDNENDGETKDFVTRQIEKAKNSRLILKIVTATECSQANSGLPVPREVIVQNRLPLSATAGAPSELRYDHEKILSDPVAAAKYDADLSKYLSGDPDAVDAYEEVLQADREKNAAAANTHATKPKPSAPFQLCSIAHKYTNADVIAARATASKQSSLSTPKSVHQVPGKIADKYLPADYKTASLAQATKNKVLQDEPEKTLPNRSSVADKYIKPNVPIISDSKTSAPPTKSALPRKSVAEKYLTHGGQKIQHSISPSASSSKSSNISTASSATSSSKSSNISTASSGISSYHDSKSSADIFLPRRSSKGTSTEINIFRNTSCNSKPQESLTQPFSGKEDEAHDGRSAADLEKFRMEQKCLDRQRQKMHEDHTRNIQMREKLSMPSAGYAPNSVLVNRSQVGHFSRHGSFMPRPQFQYTSSPETHRQQRFVEQRHINSNEFIARRLRDERQSKLSLPEKVATKRTENVERTALYHQISSNSTTTTTTGMQRPACNGMPAVDGDCPIIFKEDQLSSKKSLKNKTQSVLAQADDLLEDLDELLQQPESSLHTHNVKAKKAENKPTSEMSENEYRKQSRRNERSVALQRKHLQEMQESIDLLKDLDEMLVKR